MFAGTGQVVGIAVFAEEVVCEGAIVGGGIKGVTVGVAGVSGVFVECLIAVGGKGVCGGT